MGPRLTNNGNSIKRILYISLLPQSQVQILLQSLKLSNMPLTYSQDMKMILYMIGKQDASCKHSRYACTSCAPWDKVGIILTVGMAKKLIREFKAAVEKYGVMGSRWFGPWTMETLSTSSCLTGTRTTWSSRTSSIPQSSTSCLELLPKPSST